MSNPRIKYLSDKWGLQFDPFEASVAEIELKTEQNLDLQRQASRFFAYFSAPQIRTPDGKELSIQELRAPQHSFINGMYGSGKTTLRVHLDADCRTTLDRTFSANYILGQEFQQPLSPNQHGEHLARALARDLLIQIIEQYLPTHAVSRNQEVALRLLLDLGDPSLAELVERILKDPEPAGYAGLADHWRFVGRTPVRFIPASPELKKLLEKVSNMPPQAISHLHGWDKVWAVHQAGQGWLVEKVLLMVDGVDAARRSPEEMFAYLEPLLNNLSQLAKQRIFVKFFLPVEIAPLMDAWCARHDPGLCFSIQRATIIWTDTALKNLIQQRFSAAGMRYLGMDELAEGTLQNKLDARLLKTAQGSPRRLIRLVSNLINAHVAYRPEQSKLDERDWVSMQKMGSAELKIYR